MLLAEELMLLFVPRTSGPLAPTTERIFALAGAVLVELDETGQLDFEDDWVTVLRGDGHPLAPDLSDGTVGELMATVGRGLYRRLLDRLTDQGVLVLERRWWTLGLLPTTVWRLSDRERRDDLRVELAATVIDEIEQTPRAVTLIGLLLASGARKVLAELSANKMTWESWMAGRANELTTAVLEAIDFGVPEWHTHALGSGGSGGDGG